MKKSLMENAIFLCSGSNCFSTFYPNLPQQLFPVIKYWMESNLLATMCDHSWLLTYNKWNKLNFSWIYQQRCLPRDTTSHFLIGYNIRKKSVELSEAVYVKRYSCFFVYSALCHFWLTQTMTATYLLIN